MAGMDPETLTVAFFAREEGRAKAPAALHKAVEAAGGKIAAEDGAEGPRAAEVARRPGQGARRRARRPGRRALVAQVGERRQRLLRELEKLALEHGPGARDRRRGGAGDRCASSAERKAWTLADALVAGDEKGATRLLLELRQQGERLPSLQYQMVRRVRDALAIAEALAAGQPAAQVRTTLRMPSFAADRLIADVSTATPSRTGGRWSCSPTSRSRAAAVASGGALSEDTAAVRAVIAAIALRRTVATYTVAYDRPGWTNA